MKTRNGFVSNSSSASFVIIGYSIDNLAKNNDEKLNIIKKYKPSLLDKVNPDDYELDDAWNNFINDGNLFGIDGISWLSDDGPGYIGVILADIHCDGDYLENNTISMEDVMKKVNNLREILEIKELPKIYTGTRSC